MKKVVFATTILIVGYLLCRVYVQSQQRELEKLEKQIEILKAKNPAPITVIDYDLVGTYTVPVFTIQEQEDMEEVVDKAVAHQDKLLKTMDNLEAYNTATPSVYVKIKHFYNTTRPRVFAKIKSWGRG